MASYFIYIMLPKFEPLFYIDNVCSTFMDPSESVVRDVQLFLHVFILDNFSEKFGPRPGPTK